MAASPRYIIAVTGTRAELGLLAPVMRAIDAHRRLRLGVVATGTHLTRGTWREIPSMGFQIAAKVPMQRRGGTGRAADVAALGRGITGLGAAFDKLKPDAVLVLGDRVEVLAAACAAAVGGYRLAHIHGGDRAEGIADESMRHAVSKLAHLHFTASALSRERLIRMGENPKRVFNTGSPAIDGLQEIQPYMDADGPGVVVMQHPIGAADSAEERWMKQTLAAVGEAYLFAPNSDPGSAGIRRALRPYRCTVIEHLPRGDFLRLLAGARAIVGNSSAGLIEAAGLRVPCVNIGPRQGGREKPSNVIDCGYGETNVRLALARALKMDRRRIRHPYGDGRTGPRIAQILATIDLTAISTRKQNAY
ncbi:MAG: UDP-N-acetylglucosamine 2-epimerase [Planctomycetes bacterium]|nr:UDP-N-acetylglucosamine 2-epimerase [Planctomycetota bacterium]